MSESRRPLVFLAVGIGNTLFDFGIYSVLALTVFQNSIAAAGLVSGTLSLVVAFIAHKLITWRGRQLDKSTPLKFLVFTGFGMWVLRPILLALFVMLPWIYGFAHGISTALRLPFSYDFVVSTGAFGFMIIIVLMYNYFVYDRYVFTQKSRHTELENR